ncbi:organic hydroperoxide resistance protein [Agarilytica rhodophyticola]|uniref:organic hydroperoxide resistance protein n=1 Tax=Agarilytica rhodophyticola TaxID=1737490 RepID=UPI000B34880D|nr:organic hydroperoxide resistance protein [Agarilytica rhodophyticola]
MSKPEKILYTAITKTTGGREGTAKSSDGNLDVRLTMPKELGGSGEAGTNPEQLFAAGYSACFIGAMGVAAGIQKVTLPADTTVDAEVGIGPSNGGFGLQVLLKVSLPGLENANELVKQAHQICPYSNATRNNIDVSIEVSN